MHRTNCQHSSGFMGRRGLDHRLGRGGRRFVESVSLLSCRAPPPPPRGRSAGPPLAAGASGLLTVTKRDFAGRNQQASEA